MTGVFQLSGRAWPRREITAVEARRLRQRARVPAGQLVLFLLLPLLLACAGWLVGSAAGWLLREVDLSPDGSARVGAWSFGALGLAVDVVLARVLRQERMLERADLRAGEVELIEVIPRIVLDLGTERRPAWVFDCGEDVLLYLAGDWLHDRTVYGALGAPAGAPPPALPCTRFTLVRAPRSGVVVRVETAGEPLAPQRRTRPPGMRVAALEWRESELLEGSLGDDPTGPHAAGDRG